LPIPIDYRIHFKVSAGTRSTVLGGDSVWVPGLVIGSSRRSLVVLWGHHGGDGRVTHSGLRYRLPSPTSLVVKEDEVIVDNKSSILSSSIVAPLIWDMDGGSGP
jgi:hypothetical protein